LGKKSGNYSTEKGEKQEEIFNLQLSISNDKWLRAKRELAITNV
jgi:hypothetical protein